MSRRGVILLAAAVPIVIIFAVLVWTAIENRGQPRSAVVNSQFGQVDVDTKPAPEISMTTLDGRPISVEALRGKVVMIDFWASWCPPCRQEAPGLAQVYRRYHDLGVEFIGVDIWDTPQDAMRYVEQFGLPFPVVLDEKGTAAIDYGVKGIPEKFFVDHRGMLVRKYIGPMSEGRLSEILDEMLLAAEGSS